MSNFTFAAIDRRIKERIPFWAMVSVREVSADSVTSTKDISNETFANCVNISDTGMFLETFERYNKGSILALNIDAPNEDGSEHYKFLTKVMHSSKLKQENARGIGVEFIKKPRSINRLLE